MQHLRAVIHDLKHSNSCLIADQVSGASGKDRLVPEDPVDAALCRVWADKVNRECCSPYYAVLVRKDPKEQKHAIEALISGLRSFSRQLEKTNGPLFLPDAQVGSTQDPWKIQLRDIAPPPEMYRRSRLLHPETEARRVAGVGEWAGSCPRWTLRCCHGHSASTCSSTIAAPPSPSRETTRPSQPISHGWITPSRSRRSPHPGR